MAVHTITDADFKDVIKSNDKVVVKFYANWCGSCKLIAPKYTRMSEEENFSGIHFTEMNAEENPQTRQDVAVNNLPFFATFQGGKLISSSPTAKKEKIQSMIEELL